MKVEIKITRLTAKSRVLLVQYFIKYTKVSEMYGSLRNVRKSKKCTGVLEMYFKTLLHMETVQKVQKN